MLNKAGLCFLATVCITTSIAYPDKDCILNYFKSVEGNKILSGSFGGFNMDDNPNNTFSLSEAEGIFNLTNKYPAIYGMDCYRGGTTEPGEESDLIECFSKDLLEHVQKGGIVTVNSVLPNAILPGNVPRTNEGSSLMIVHSNEEYRKLVTKGTAERDRLFKMYDKIAEGIATYAAHGVTVLYRPYLEMNANFFWWANTDNNEKDQERIDLFKKLWRELHNYFTIEKGLENIIWIYSVYDGAKFKTDFYPGNEFVDIVGLTVYLNDFSYVQGYDEMLALRKPLVFAEVGPMHASLERLMYGKLDYEDMVDKINRYYPKVIYFLAWNNMWSPIRNDKAKEAFNNERVLNLDDVNINCDGKSQSQSRTEL